MVHKSLLLTLQADYPQFHFIAADDFRWSANEQTVYYDTSGHSGDLLHELSHGILGHYSFGQDIELIRIEREAWQYATTHLASYYQVHIDSDYIEDAIESYRQWLHTRSLCPKCTETGLQQKHGTYVCAMCQCQWRANDARSCTLRRFTL